MIFRNRIEKALDSANLEGFTTKISWDLKRYVVANTNNTPDNKIDESFKWLLTRQAETLYLAYDNVNIWGWKDEKTGLIYIDISTSFDKLEDAIAFAKETKQIAIWDNKEFKEIRVKY